MATSPFTWGMQGKKMTPQEVARQRALAMQLQSSAVDTSPVGHWSAGAARLVNAFSGMRKDRQAGAAEDEGRAGAKAVIDALLGGGGDVSMSSSGTLAPGQAAMVDSFGAPPATPGMTGGGSFPQGEADPAMPPAPAGGTEQALSFAAKNIGLNEREQGAALKDYMATGGVNLDPATTAWCAAYVNASLGKAGIQGTGSNMARSFLDWGVAADTPQRGDIGVMSRGDPNGPYGHVGFVDGLNPDGTVRLLGGNQGDAVSVQNYSPDAFLGFRRAGEGGGVSASTMGGSPAAGGTSPVMQALLQASSDPWVAQEYGPVLNALMGQEQARQSQAMAQADPMYQLQMQKAQMELQQMQSPEAPKPIEVGGVLLDPVTYQPIFDSRANGANGAVPSEVQALQWRAQEAGLTPGTQPYQDFIMNGGSRGTGVPAGFAALDAQAKAGGLTPGTPEYQDFMLGGGAGQRAAATTTGKMQAEARVGLPSTIATAERALENIEAIRNDPALPGITGMVQGRIPPMTPDGTDLNVRINQAKGQTFLEAFESLKGAGQITEIEGQKAEQAIARLDRAQSTEAYQAALDDLADVLRSGMDRARGKAGVAPPPSDLATANAPPRGGLLPAPPDTAPVTAVGPMPDADLLSKYGLQ